MIPTLQNYGMMVSDFQSLWEESSFLFLYHGLYILTNQIAGGFLF